MCQRNLKRLIVLMLFVSVGMCSLVRADDVATIRQSLSRLRASLDELEKLKKEYGNKTDDQKKLAEEKYVRDARKTWSEFRTIANSLESSLESYSSKSGVAEATMIKAELSRFKTAADKVGELINKGSPNDGIGNAYALKDAIREISGLFPLTDSSPNGPKPPQTTIGQSQASTSAQSGDVGESDIFSILDSLLYALGALLMLAGIGAAFFWLNRRIVSVERSLKQQQSQDGAQIRQNVTLQVEEFWDKYQKQRNLDQQNQQDEYARLQNEIERLRIATQSAKPRVAAVESPTIRRREESSVERVAHVPAAPKIVSATEYLNRAGNNAIRAKAVMFRPEILQQANDDGPFMLLPDDGTRNIYKVLPGVPRFQSSQDYSHFAYFYDCDQPSSGELLILEPALATYDESAGQWTLKRKGRLQIS